MAITKKESFSADEQQLAALCKALSHPARIAILKQLAERNACICGEIVELLPLAQSTVSQHLKELKQAGLVKGTIDGVKSCFCIDWDGIYRFESFFKEIINHIKKHENNEKCC